MLNFEAPQIPEATSLIFTVPTLCPSCCQRLKFHGEYLVCTHVKCPAQVAGAVKRWVKKLDIKDWGETLIDSLCDNGIIKTPADLYRLRELQLSTHMLNGKRLGSSTAQRIMHNLEAKKQLRLAEFVGSLGIPLCGRTVVQMIVDAGYDSIDKMEEATVAQIALIPRMGQTKAEAFVDGLKRRKRVMDELLAAGVRIKTAAVGVLSGKSVCFTGFRDKELEDRVLEAGGSMHASVTKKTTYLVAKDPTSNSGKFKKASDYGVQILGIHDLEALL